MAQNGFKSGAVIEVGHPFMRDTYHGLDADGPFECGTWRPGIYFDGPDDCAGDASADGMGKQILTIISVHKPGRWPTRIFYTREWEAPDGKRFGKPKLFCKSAAAFRILTNGYRYPFDLKPAPPTTGERCQDQ